MKEKLNIKNILVIRLAGLGDMLLTLSAIAPLKKIYPDANIFFLTDNANLKFLKCFDFVTDTIEYKRGLKDTLSTIRILRKLDIDTVINFERALKKSIIAFFTKSKIRIGYDIFLNNFFNTNFAKDLKDDPSIHMRQRYFELTKLLGIEDFETILNFTPTPSASEKVEFFFNQHKIDPVKDLVIGINPVTGFKSKYWINDRWAEVADFLIKEFNAKVIFTYGPSDDQLQTCLDIIKKMSNQPILSFKTNLIEFGALLKKLKLLICLDSGPFHFAVSLNTPTISLWGRGNIKQWATDAYNHWIISKNVECSPCSKFECENPICMSQISSTDVINQIKTACSKLGLAK